MSLDPATLITQSGAQALAERLLSTVPGLPPILQTIHLLSIAAILGSAVIVNLRLLQWAVPTQHPEEMVRRLQAWTWYGLLGVLSSGIWFVLARPSRYFSNPVFQIKFALLFMAVALTLILYRQTLGNRVRWTGSWQQVLAGKGLALLSLLLWIAVVLAGRWIAYVEYLFWEG